MSEAALQEEPAGSPHHKQLVLPGGHTDCWRRPWGSDKQVLQCNKTLVA